MPGRPIVVSTVAFIYFFSNSAIYREQSARTNRFSNPAQMSLELSRCETCHKLSKNTSQVHVWLVFVMIWFLGGVEGNETAASPGGRSSHKCRTTGAQVQDQPSVCSEHQSAVGMCQLCIQERAYKAYYCTRANAIDKNCCFVLFKFLYDLFF